MSLIKILDNAKFFGKTIFGTEAAPSYDAAAAAYIAAVEAADGQALETPVKAAYNDFIVGCKADGIWNAFKASCIMAGARTLNGALVPLVGTAPTNFNFVSADYNRKTGLKATSSTKYISTNRANNADPQNSQHLSVYATESTGNGYHIATNPTVSGSSSILASTVSLAIRYYSRGVDNSAFDASGLNTRTGFLGLTRSTSTSYVGRNAGTNTTFNRSSASPSSETILLFARPGATNAAAHRISFYSIGESLDLSKLDTRVSALTTAINAAI